MDTQRFPATVLLAGVVCLATAPAGAQEKVDRRGTTITNAVADVARDGPLPAYEPALLDLVFAPASARPEQLKVALKTERFRSQGGGWCVPVVLSVDAAGLTPIPVEVGEPGGGADFRVDALALITNAEGQIVAKMTRSARFRATRDQLLAFRAEQLPLTCVSPSQCLSPGRYTLTVGVHDPTSKRASVISRSFTLPDLPPPSAPVPSSLVLSRAAEPAAEHDPFEIGSVRVVSNATGRFGKARGDRLITYFKLYGPASVAYNARVKFYLGDRLVVMTPMTQITIGLNGETSAAPIVGLDLFEPGAYRAVLHVFAPGSATPVATATTPFFVDP
jgi:hypothetical protein